MDTQVSEPSTAAPMGACAGTLDRDGSIELSGDLDFYSAPALLELIQRVVRDHARRGLDRVQIRCPDLDFCDSSGLAVLIRAHQGARDAGIALTLVECPPHLVYLLSLSGVEYLFPVGGGGR